MEIISTRDLRTCDVPQGDFNWSAFSKFALTFDPLTEVTDDSTQVSVRSTPALIWTVVELRYFLYCWQRVENNQGGLMPESIESAQTTLNILRSKI